MSFTSTLEASAKKGERMTRKNPRYGSIFLLSDARFKNNWCSPNLFSAH
jgi:hypothetical protein